MKKFTAFHLLILFTISIICATGRAQSTAHAPQLGLISRPMERAMPVRIDVREGRPEATISGAEVPASPLNADFIMPSGLDSLPIVGSFAFQSDGRPLHNIQIDPSNPLNIHAVITDAQDPSAADTAKLLTRRCFYTFSSDGGMTWKKPVTFSSVRTGYADMQLFERNGKYVPIIAAHRVLSAGSSSIETGVWIEKGNPGDGNFSESLAPNVNAVGTPAQIAWPTVAMSPTNDTAYVLGSVYDPGGSTDQLQFGRFILNAAKDSAVFDGSQWDAEPGAAPGNVGGNFPQPGLTSGGGGTRIRVSPSGTIGVMWVNADATDLDEGIYFAESTDGGNTWPSTLNALWSPSNQQTDANGAQLAPIYGNVDFWFDRENPKFLFTLGATILSNQTYYPSTATLSFYNPTDGTNQIIPIVSPYLQGAMDPAAFEQTDSVKESIRAPDPFIAWATVARTPDTNVFAVFYQTYVEGDTELINTPSDPTLDTSFVYGSIYYQTTTDGGQTWSSATPLLSASAHTPKLDFRQPMTSDFNPVGSGGPVYKVATVIDTAPGNLYRNGIYGFDLHYYALATLASSGVNEQPAASLSISVASAYPDPASNVATIQYSLNNASSALLTVSDMLGRTIKTLVSGMVGPGQHSVQFSTAGLPNGVYRYTLEADGGSVSKSMSIMR